VYQRLGFVMANQKVYQWLGFVMANRLLVDSMEFEMDSLLDRKYQGSVLVLLRAALLGPQ